FWTDTLGLAPADAALSIGDAVARGAEAGVPCVAGVPAFAFEAVGAEAGADVASDTLTGGGACGVLTLARSEVESPYQTT
ncbi:MAG: hypothetical protein M3N08_00250, partial [Pseudomonadota bacterium]|nr:hypothetical protein [Pseudomonadota bacterium]